MSSSGATTSTMFLNRISVLLLLLLCSGCVPFRKDGTTHYIVFGFGYIRVNHTNEVAAKIVDSSVIGAYLEPGPAPRAGIGFSSSTTTWVSTNSNLIISVDKQDTKLNITVP